MNVCTARRPVLPSTFVLFALFAALLILVPTSTLAQRLDPTVRPTHYVLQLAPDLKDATFSGVESIDLTLENPANEITLNALEIAFQSVTITAGGKEQTATVSLDAAKEQAIFTFPQQIAAGKATLTIHYTGILNSELRGFYLSKTARRNYAVTQFESTDARRAFPCFDEPAFKATYDISLVIDAADTAISNGPIVRDTPGPAAGKHTLSFLTTPKMSSYLVAFLVGDFQCSSGSSDGVAIRVCSTPDKVSMTPYGVEVAQSVLHYYNHYFGIPYPLKKLDLIALPDFEAGAMENFGAITYRETALLIDPKTASIDAKQEVALVIAHEMAHQWFGDLVTMKWWDNIWLNEGFATWMESKAVGVIHPEWNMDQMTAGDSSGTLDYDAQPTTRAIRATADTRDEIEEMFDGISYGKAGAVLRMVENYLGEETFRQGVHNYLAAHLYSNATAEDFWGAQTANSHKPVDKIMESLVAQPGVPLITFGTPANGAVPVAQRRFFLSPNTQPDPAQKWTLPICFKTAAGQSCQLLTPETTSLKIPVGALLFANAHGKGYYRSAYAPAQYTQLVSAVETGLSPAERISLIGDEWAQVRADKATVGDFLNLAAAVKSDSSADVVGRSLNSVGAIYTRVAATPAEKDGISAWIRRTYTPAYLALGKPAAGESVSTNLLRARLFDVLGSDGKDPAVLADARETAKQYIQNPPSVDPAIGQISLALTARNGDAALFDTLQHVYETTTNPDFQSGALELLAQFEDPKLLERALDYALSSKVRNQDSLREFSTALYAENTRPLAWAYLQQHWDQVKTELTPEMGAGLVSSMGSFCSADAREQVKEFFATHKVPASAGPLKRALERIDGCIELRTLQEPKLDEWLAAQTQ